MNWMLRRLREASTWRGLVWLATVAGLSLRPEQAEAIVTVGMAISGLLGVFMSDEPKNVHIELPPVELVAQASGAVRSADPAPQRRNPVADRLRQPVPTQRQVQRGGDQNDVPAPPDSGWNG